MKKIIIALPALMLALTGCEDWLDLPSQTKYDSDTVFENLESAEMAVTGCYGSSFHRELYYQFGMGTDVCYAIESLDNSKNWFGNYVFTAQNSPSSTYTTMYTGIERANMCIKRLNMYTPSEKEQKRYNQILGEAYAIRAICYHNLCCHYGDVPFSTDPQEDAGTFFSHRVSRDIIYDQCVSDLQKASELCAWASENLTGGPERFTKNSALGILARVALYAAGYSLRWDLSTTPYSTSTMRLARRDDAARVTELYKIAADACKKVIEQGENSLLGNFETVWRDILNNRTNNETMLEYGQRTSNMKNLRTGYENGIHATTGSMFGKALPVLAMVPTLWFDYKEGDLRREVTVCNYAISSGSERWMLGYADRGNGKFRVDWKEDKGISDAEREISFPILRYSDVLLMYAEAVNEISGPTAEAQDALKQVRLRAFGGDESKIGEIPSGKEDFLKAIIEERKLELAGESWRRTDLVRWNILCETLQKTKLRIFDMCNRAGEFAGDALPRHASYKRELAVNFAEDITSVKISGYHTDAEVSDRRFTRNLAAQGLTYIDLFAASEGTSSRGNKLGIDELWVASLFRGMVGNFNNTVNEDGKCKAEIAPLSQTGIIDVNEGLKYEQHPAY